MELLSQVIVSVFQWQNLIALLSGSLFGIIIGVLPGLGPAAGMALVLPFVLKLEPVTALIFIGSLYKCSNYGGSITAILVNTPGDAANAATVMDGYPLCEKGKAGIALGLSATGAMVGGTIGMICLIFTAPFLAKFALQFGPAEYFWVAIIALSIIATSSDDILKGIISGGVGLMLSTVGLDSIIGNERFTFGWTAVMDGMPFIPVLVGLFAVTQALVLAESAESISRIGKIAGGFFEGVVIYFKHIFSAIRSAAIGLFIGILPAAGMSSAGLLAWSIAKSKAKHPETFGKGNPEGVIASETATNACMPGDLVCTLALGVPGSMGAAIFLGIMIALGVVPGPLVFKEKADVVYTLFAALVLTSFLLFLFGMFLSRQMAAVTLLPNEIIVPAVLVISLLGSYAVNMNMNDVIISLAFGAIGYIMQKTGFSPIPLLLGLVLGEMVESNYHRALLMSRGSYSIFLSSTISQILCLLTVVLYVMPYLGPLWRRLRGADR